MKMRPTTSEPDRMVLRLLWGNRCAYCRCVLDNMAQADHLIPLSRGGPHHAGNVAASCPACNERKGTRTAIEFRANRVEASAARILSLLEGFWTGDPTATAITCRLALKDLLFSSHLFKPTRLGGLL